MRSGIAGCVEDQIVVAPQPSSTRPPHIISTVGLIGLGQMASDNHLPILAELGVRPVWYIDQSAEKWATIGRHYGGRLFSPDVEFAALPSVDLVLISSPYGSRARYLKDLARLQTHCAIYIEKPIALTSPEHGRIAALRSDYMVAAGFNKRSIGKLQFIREAVANGLFGDLRRCAIYFGGVGIKTGGRYLGDLELAGGGMLFEVGVHYIDAVNYVLTAQSCEVLNARMIFDHGFEIHTVGEYLLTGPFGNTRCNLTASVIADVGNRMEFIFDHVALSTSLFSNELTLTSSNSQFSMPLELPRDYQIPDTGITSLCAHWRDFLQGIRDAKSNYTNLCNCRVTTQVIEGLYTHSGRQLCSE